MTPQRGRVVVAAAGELDLANAGRLEAQVCDLLDRGFGQVVLDLRELTFIDSSGIHTLLSCQRHAAARSGRVPVIVGQGGVWRAIDLCGVQCELDVILDGAAL